MKSQRKKKIRPRSTRITTSPSEEGTLLERNPRRIARSRIHSGSTRGSSSDQGGSAGYESSISRARYGSNSSEKTIQFGQILIWSFGCFFNSFDWCNHYDSCRSLGYSRRRCWGLSNVLAMQPFGFRKPRKAMQDHLVFRKGSLGRKYFQDA